ncbi:hypothetical protein EDD37DRAFT_34286 [Exophiala viscosa]|uniref:uncharacterized protein n=1 Tax=Exophiala viscosa TaxID=2486360 RepID=UPI00218CC8F2|nr:hypothetical protein EDD37DRAFT_34286 [Exophiala viscosa]
MNVKQQAVSTHWDTWPLPLGFPPEVSSDHLSLAGGRTLASLSATYPDMLRATISPIDRLSRASDTLTTPPMPLPRHVVLLLPSRLRGVFCSHHGQLLVDPQTNLSCNNLMLQLFFSKLSFLLKSAVKGEYSDKPDEAVAEGDEELETGERLVHGVSIQGGSSGLESCLDDASTQQACLQTDHATPTDRKDHAERRLYASTVVR